MSDNMMIEILCMRCAFLASGATRSGSRAIQQKGIHIYQVRYPADMTVQASTPTSRDDLDENSYRQPSEAPVRGKIHLCSKTRPTCDLPEDAQKAVPLCRTCGYIPVTSIRRLLQDGGLDIWSSETAAAANVDLVRPSHDAWGIRKIIFVYCDDFLRRRFELPWLHDPAWRGALLPVFDCLGIPLDKVVRCLLASMPPGVRIPPHHDTGHWVRHTHRIHLPIITSPANIVFRVGATVEQMRRFDLAEGFLVELNNQAKHSVENHWDQHRVHLIFDYVEDYVLERIRLQPGTRLSQTRRSIDLRSERGRRSCPTFMILGAQKAGTTSMYECLCQHPLILRARRRETHFFDWRWPEKAMTDAQRLQLYNNFFEKEHLDANPSCLTGESTPSYMLYPEALTRIQRIVPHVKFIVMLRDPVARAYSHYQMVIDPKGTPEQKKARGTHWLGKTFEQVVEEDMRDLLISGLGSESNYEEFRHRYLASLPQGFGSHSLLARGFYALQLEPWLKAFGPKQMMICYVEDMSTRECTHTLVNKVFDYLELPFFEVVNTDIRNSRTYEPMAQSTKEMLTEMYRPYDERLARLLGQCPPWRRRSN